MKLKDNGVLEEIKTFRKELKSYKRLLWLEELTDAQKIYKDRLRDKLISKMGQYRDTIIKLTGKQYFRQFGQEYDMWADSLNIHAYLPHQKVSLDYCIDAVIEAIGKLETAPLPEPEPQGVSIKEPPKAFVVDNGEKRLFEEAWEIEIQGDDIKRLYPIIRSVAVELRFKDCFFEARLASQKETDSYAPFDVFTIQPTTSKTPVGVFTLQSLGNNRIMLRVPPRSRWHHDGGLTATELMVMGLSKSEYDEHFGQFIKSLEDRFTHYGLKETLLKRLWRRFKELIEIAKVVKP